MRAFHSQPSFGQRGLGLRWLLAVLLGWLALMQAALWGFLGLLGEISLTLFLAALVALQSSVLRSQHWGQIRIPLPRMGGLLLVSLLLLALGGEGRFFYANTDWQVRHAVLRDLTIYPWPFAYAPVNDGGTLVLRAPLGVYLLPALVGKLSSPHGAELALWVQNSVALALVLALGSALFATLRQRWIALGVVIGFSGLDGLGQWLAGKSLLLHLEQWAGLQFSSHVTQAFWVPQHGLAGWIFACLYLLWRRRLVPLAALVAVMPLLALLSPLAVMGCVPFAIHAGLASLAQGRLKGKAGYRTIAVGLLACALAAPGLEYLAAGSRSVGGGPSAANFNGYGLFIALEIGVYAYGLWQAGRAGGGKRWGKLGGQFVAAPLLIAVGTLVVVPFGQIGGGMDFCMRASIPALAVLSVMVADLLGQPAGAAGRRLVLVPFVLGLATPLGEIGRALVYPPSPQVVCSYLGVVPNGASTYVAPLRALPAMLQKADRAMVRPHDPPRCWNGPWPDAATGRDTLAHPSANIG